MTSLPRSMSADDVALEHGAGVVQTGTPPGSDETALATRGGGRAMQQADDSPATSPMDLIHYAIEKGLPAEQLEKLAALHDRMEDRNAARAFHRALNDFRRECPPIKKNKSKSFSTKDGGSLSWSYAEFDVIEAHIKPYLDKHDLSYVFDQELSEKGALSTSICTLSHILGHSRQSRFTVPTTSNSAASPQQKVGAADSYAQRRALAAVLGLNITDKEVPDEEVDPTVISEDQSIVIEDLINELAKSRKRVRERFFKYMEVDKVADIRAADYQKALAALRLPEDKQP